MKIYKKIFLSIMSLLLLVITFATTTYAWFEINSSASVEGFDFQVNSGEGFLVSIDGINYYNDLDAQKIKQAIVVGYDPTRYKIENEKVVYYDTGISISDEDVDDILNNILLLPRTSTDGIEIKDLYNAPSNSNEGSFMQFSIYFRTTSLEESDNMDYDIYLATEDITLDDGTILPKTSIISDPTNVSLEAQMTTTGGLKNPGDDIQVYSANAMRMSIEDTSLETTKATIYELTNSMDLGSYATDYDMVNDNSAITDIEKQELNNLYNCNNNAMFTYYNNLRPYAQLTPLAYANVPNTIRDFNSDTIPSITNVKSGNGAKLVTFRFWLEGWDADCFDGLDKSIKVKLSFTSKRNYGEL